MPDSTVRRWLQDLVELEYLAQVEASKGGAGKTTRYRVVDRGAEGRRALLGLLTPAELRGAAVRNPPPAKTRQTAVAGFSSSRVNEIAPNPPPRHGNQQGSVSAKTARLLKLYAEDLRTALRREDGAAVPGRHARLPGLARGARARAPRGAHARTCMPTRPSSTRAEEGRQALRRQLAPRPAPGLKSLFRFLYRRGYVLTNPAASVPLPRPEKRLPRTILTPEEARRILEARSRQAAARAARPRDPRDLLRDRHPRGRAGEPQGRGRRHRGADPARRPRQGRQGPQRPAHAAAAEAIEAYLVRRAKEPRRPGEAPASSSWRSRRPKLDRARLGRIVHAVGEGRGRQEARHLPHLPPQRGDAPPQGRRRHPPHPGAPRPRVALDDRALHARRDLGPRAVVKRAHPRGR